jgi:hypothetical protein
MFTVIDKKAAANVMLHRNKNKDGNKPCPPTRFCLLKVDVIRPKIKTNKNHGCVSDGKTPGKYGKQNVNASKKFTVVFILIPT